MPSTSDPELVMGVEIHQGPVLHLRTAEAPPSVTPEQELGLRGGSRGRRRRWKKKQKVVWARGLAG